MSFSPGGTPGDGGRAMLNAPPRPRRTTSTTVVFNPEHHAAKRASSITIAPSDAPQSPKPRSRLHSLMAPSDVDLRYEAGPGELGQLLPDRPETTGHEASSMVDRLCLGTYEALWRTGSAVLVSDTLAFHNGRPVSWWFTSAKAKEAEEPAAGQPEGGRDELELPKAPRRQLRRKHSATMKDVTPEDIAHAFSRPLPSAGGSASPRSRGGHHPLTPSTFIAAIWLAESHGGASVVSRALAAGELAAFVDSVAEARATGVLVRSPSRGRMPATVHVHYTPHHQTVRLFRSPRGQALVRDTSSVPAYLSEPRDVDPRSRASKVLTAAATRVCIDDVVAHLQRHLDAVANAKIWHLNLCFLIPDESCLVDFGKAAITKPEDLLHYGWISGVELRDKRRGQPLEDQWLRPMQLPGQQRFESVTATATQSPFTWPWAQTKGEAFGVPLSLSSVHAGSGLHRPAWGSRLPAKPRGAVQRRKGLEGTVFQVPSTFMGSYAHPRWWKGWRPRVRPDEPRKAGPDLRTRPLAVAPATAPWTDSRSFARAAKLLGSFLLASEAERRLRTTGVPASMGVQGPLGRVSRGPRAGAQGPPVRRER